MAMKSTLSVNQPTLRHFNVYVAFVTLILISTPFVSAQDLEYPTKNGICKSMDIRNSLETFQKLKGCRVVEGFVQILLFDNVNETLLSNISFPELMEITDYLLLFRVNGLRSIGQLFPNLTVIRGQNSFFGYSFIVFEMSSLQEVALYSLSNITNGSIRIDKNPSLCFIKSIDWEKIVSPRDLEFNYINIMKPENECPICPGEELPKDDIVTVERPKICPTAPFKSKTVDFSRRRHLCWNRHHCQKICPRGCTACNNKDQCCHRDCLGGCADDNVNNCKVCRNFEVWEGSIRKCVDSCPNGTLEFLGRRCISHTECRKMPRPINLPSSKPFHPYNIYSNKCVLKCPVNMNVVKQRCVECDQGRCVKSCNGVNIDSIEIAKQLTGCTHITGSLEIQIRGGSNIVNLLEESLGMIEEIDGYLKVVRSFPLVSLNFLKSLKRIRGESLDSQKFVFVVLDNQNLQDLWDWKDGRTLKIDNGRLFFHFNPKLCLKEIRTLQNKTGIDPPFTELEVAISSNGDKIACDVRNLSVEVKKKMSKAVSLSWKPVLLEDQRNLLGYIVYSIQAKYRNVTLYDGRDACGGDGWRVDDVTIPEDHTPEVVHLLTQLKPYTQYAYYVKTYTIAKENIGAQSPIQYFRTEAEVPSPPLRLVVTSDGSDSLKITWSPPKDPNGNVTSYFITGKKRETLYDEYNTRNHCGELSVMPYQPSTEPPPKVVTPTVYNGTCSCDDKTKEPGINEDVQVERIDFENALHNEVYIRKDNTESRKRRDVYNTFPTIKNTLHNIENQGVGNVTKNGTVISFERTVYGKTDFSINKLHHFTYYDITIQACREKEHPKDDKICSYQAMESGRTLVRNGADNITRVYIINQTLESVTIKWNDLRDPNGMVFKYSIEYKRNNENSKASFDCITHKEWLLQEKTYTLKLSPGNYSLRVSAITAGNSGKYSPYVVFVIKEPNNVAVLALSIIIPIFILSCLSLLLCYRKYSIQKASMRLVPRVNPEYMSSAYVPDEWEIPRSNIQLIKELGQGSFGMVYEGTVTDLKGKNPKKCAVKTVNENSTDRERIDFLNEASVMKAFDTAHVVRLLGVVSEGQPTYVVMELMANGDLKSYLRSHRPDTENFTGTGRSAPTLKQILQMAIEIADGMAYLSAKKFVHRDLAARNCMVSENLVVKIGDFGMTRDIYETDYYRKGTKGLLPVRWMAPESLKDGVFTSASDAWSYGIVIWEMATLASQPYQGLSNDQVLRYVIDGGMMCKPENCPDKLYEIMKECWNHSALKRPSFIQLCTKLLCDASATFAEVSFFHSAAGLEARMSARPPPSPQDNPSTPLRKSGCLDKNYLLNNNSDDDSDSEIGTHLVFSSIMNFEHTDYRPSPIHANGYVSGCPTNGAATTQC